MSAQVQHLTRWSGHSVFSGYSLRENARTPFLWCDDFGRLFSVPNRYYLATITSRQLLVNIKRDVAADKVG